MGKEKMIFRQKILMGEARGRAIYFDVKENQIYEVPKSSLLDTEGAVKSMKHYGIIMGIIFCLPIVGRLIPGINKGLLTATPIYLIIFPILWILLAVGFIYMMEVVLYKNIDQAKVGRRSDFRYAIQTNAYTQTILKGKKVRKYNIISTIFFVGLMELTAVGAPAAVIIRFDTLNNRSMPIGLLMVLSSFGLVIGSSYLLLFQNNPVRWLRVVYKYQHGQINWAKKK